MVAAGDDEGRKDKSIRDRAEIYSPPYLFDNNDSPATRPVISAVSRSDADVPGMAITSATWDQTFDITVGSTAGGVPNPAALVNNVGKVVLIAPSAVTHANDMHQRLIELPILARNTVTGKLTVKTPLTANLAPPGYYMLFLVNLGNVLPNQPRQVPSVARWLRIGPSSIQFNAAGYGVSESMTAFTVRATRTGKIDKALTVQYATRDVTTGNRAQANVDYMPASGTLTFPAGSATPRSFVVTLLNDTTDEPDERFEVLLSNITVTPPAAPNDPIIGAPTPVFFTIRDDD